jgi:hypothetical protein
MPSTKRPKPLYQRGPYRLYPRPGRFLQIVWYDEQRKRERGISAGTADVGQGRIELDRIYLESIGERVCPTCKRPFDTHGDQLVTSAIADYLVLVQDRASIGSIRDRLNHVIRYIAATNPAITCAAIDDAWANRYRKWLAKDPYYRGKSRTPLYRSPATVEQSLMQLSAAINATQPMRPNFKYQQGKDLTESPSYRADVKTMARMFAYALADSRRKSLLLYLRAAVATWARPDAIMDLRPSQYIAAARVLPLNPKGRRQTKKYRPTIPIARQFGALLETMGDPYIPHASIRSAWESMGEELGLPRDGSAGPKVIRRSMATEARRRMGEEHWVQGQMMLGHTKHDISDIYAVPDPANLGRALAVTEAIIDEIEALAPGAYRTVTALPAKVTRLRSSKNG